MQTRPNMDKTIGILSIHTLIPYRDMNGRDSLKMVLLHMERGVTEQQAKGFFLDFKGMNPDVRIAAKWVPMPTIFA